MNKKWICLLTLIMILFSMTPCNAADNSIYWTEAELAFMSEHPVIRLGVDPEFVPFEFIDKDGEYKGITADYLEIISEKTGIQFEVEKGLTWPQAYDAAVMGDVDALPAVSKTSEREQLFLFSEPYYEFKRVIVTREEESGINDLEDLKNQTVAVQRNSSHHSYLLGYPKINLSLYDSAETALTAVANGTEKAYVGNLATTNYLIRSNGMTNLKFTAFETEKEQALYLAVRKDWPELVSIFNKSLNTITQEEKISINNKWIDLETEVDYGPILRIVAVIGGMVAIILIVSFYWINRLRKEVIMRKKIQEDLEKAKQEAIDANEFKSSFMARMSHEIRTPLNAITGMAYLLKKTEVTLTQKMYIDRITQASGNMLNIINDILDFSKIEAGKVELEVTSFSMDKVIQDVVNIVSYKIDEQEIGFKFYKDPQIPNWFFGDSKRIEQILLNILNNAAKFTHSGEVVLEIRLIAKEGDCYHLSFSIKDTGIGMTSEQIDKLFSPFVQADSSINRRFGGSGLGLSIVKNLVEMMKGKIEVFSTPNEGSTFIINLSLKIDSEKEALDVKNYSARHFKNMRTLVLEKSGSNMNLIESYLGAFGMQCELTSSPESALAMLEAADSKFADPFDLFILDYESVDGFKFIETLKRDEKIIKMPKIMILLPMMREDLFDHLDEYGIDMGIGKPIIPSILFNGIMEIFRLTALSASLPSSEIKAQAQKAGREYHVLLAEDNKTNQLITKKLLEQVGIKVFIANDGKAAVDFYCENRNRIDLILLDLHMPVLNGYEAAVEIRKISQSIPIVAMTADVILGVREKCQECGIKDYISKPFEPDHFIQMVLELLNNISDDNKGDPVVLNQEIGIRNMGGDEVIFRQVIEEYLKENENTNEQLMTAVSNRQYQEAVQIIHKVKGSAGSIGAKKVYDVSITLQKALKEENEKEVTRLLDEFLDLFEKLLREIQEYLK